MPAIPAKILIIAALLAALPACAQPVAPQPNPAPVAAEDYRRAFEAAVASLKHHGFLIDRQDYRFGRITTKPRVAPRVFEVWNADNSSLDQAMSATLNNERRVAAIRLDPASAAASPDSPAPTAAYQITVAVAIERATDPTRRLPGSTSGYRIVNDLSSTPQQYVREGITGPAYIPVGNDPLFEQKLLADIGARLGRQETGDREQGTGDREQGTGDREQGTGDREQGTGDR